MFTAVRRVDKCPACSPGRRELFLEVCGQIPHSWDRQDDKWPQMPGGMGTRHLGTVSNADFRDGDSDRKSNLFPVDVLHFGGKPLFLRADVKTASFPLSTKRGYIFCFHALNIYHFFLIWFPKASKRPTQYIIGINLGFRLHIVFKYSS